MKRLQKTIGFSNIISLVCGSLTLALTGCVSHHNLAPDLALEARATLKGADPVRLWKVDDRRGPNHLGFGSSWNGSFKIDLKPGLHTLTVGCFMNGILQTASGGAGSRSKVEFSAQAGHNYTLSARRSKGRWFILLNDYAPGQPPVSVNVAEGILISPVYIYPPPPYGGMPPPPLFYQPRPMPMPPR